MSIIIIAAIGSTVFLGLDYSARSFRANGSEHYNELKYHDIELTSTLLLDEQDLEEIRSTEGVALAEGVIQMDAKAGVGDEKKNVVLVSATQDVDHSTVYEGSLPAAQDECAVDKDLAEDLGWQIGDRIEILPEMRAVPEATEEAGFIPNLKGTSFAITALIQHPDRGNTNIPQDPYIVLAQDAFAYDAAKGAFLKAKILVDRPEDMYRYSTEYEDRVQAVLSCLEKNAESAAEQRTQRVRGLVQGILDEKQAILDEKETELSDARTELDDGWQALADGEKELEEKQKELDEAKEQLDAAADQLAEGNQELEKSREELDAAKAQLDSAAAQLSEGEAQLSQGRRELESSWDELEDVKEKIRHELKLTMNDFLGSSDSVDWAGRQYVDVNERWVTATTFQITTDYSVDLSQSPKTILGFINDRSVVTDKMLKQAYKMQNGTTKGFNADEQRASLYALASIVVDTYGDSYNSLQKSCQAWDAGHERYYKSLMEYYSQLSKYNDGLAEYNAGEELYQESLSTYDDGLSQYKKKLKKYKKGVKALEEGQKTLEENRALLEENEASYADGTAAYEDGAAKLASAQAELDAMAPCRFYIHNARGNASYNQIMDASQDLLNLKSTFALMFVLIGALVIFTTVSKIVDEQRGQVGTTKAMGFFRREIFAKYLFFGVSATALGLGLGILAARFLMTGFTLRGYNLYYRYDISESHLYLRPTLAVLGLGILLAVAAVSLACFRLLKDPAIVLMKDRIPAGGKREKRNTGSLRTLYSRLILRNMRTDMKRVLVTIVSVAGCCALVVTGVTLKNAVTGAAREQYQRIFAYDEMAGFDPAAEGAKEQMAALLDEAGAEYTGIYKSNILYRVTNNQAAELMVGDISAIHELYHLLDWESETPLVENGTAFDEGILIQRRMAEIYDLSVGDAFDISLDGTTTATVKVAGIFEHFIGNPMVMSDAYYEKIFGAPADINKYVLRLPESAEKPAALQTLNERFQEVQGFDSITTAEDARSMFDASTSVVDALVMLFIVLAIAMAGVVLLNITNMYVLQKKNELTIMRINGFTVKQTIHYVIRETVITTFLGIFFGVGLGSGLAYKIIRTMEKQFLQFDRSISFTAWAVGLLMTLGLIILVNGVALRPVKYLKLRDIQ